MVDLQKISLTKDAPAISLSKSEGAGGIIRVNLNWSQGCGKKGLFAKRSTVDLDLGCLYELHSGSKGVVQALGNGFGAVNSDPFIALDGDDRSGANTGGENMSINVGSGRIKRALIFAYIYEGAANWGAADGVVTLTPVSGPPIEVRLDAAGGNSKMCAVALLSDAAGAVSVTREVRYIAGMQKELDEAYGWGMNWTAGKK